MKKVALRLVDELDPDGAAPDGDPEPADELHRVRRRDGSIAITARIRSLVDSELLDEVRRPRRARRRRRLPHPPAARRRGPQGTLRPSRASPTGIATDTRQHPMTPAGEPFDKTEVDAETEVDGGTADGAETGDAADAPTSADDRCARVAVNGRALLAITIDHRWLQ